MLRTAKIDLQRSLLNLHASSGSKSGCGSDRAKMSLEQNIGMRQSVGAGTTMYKFIVQMRRKYPEGLEITVRMTGRRRCK